ncbi:AMP-binding protein [Pendulispora rubella]|uniref:AMP-binding protein n=1 Tax=Pendulispora rubella TaxID=2741070 RepID=A0ABZ2LF40_9BACT
MLEGFVPFPPELVARYRDRGYWRGRTLAQEFALALERFSDRTALIDGARHYRYADLDRLSDNLALNLLGLGLRPLDRVVLSLPNTAEFVILYLALQKIGCIPIAALVTHRYAELRQFVVLSQARACVYPAAHGDFHFGPVAERIAREAPSLSWRIALGEPGPGEHSLTRLIEEPAATSPSVLEALSIDSTDPCIFQLSGGTTGIPKLIPRTNEDYAYNSRVAAEVTLVDEDSVLLLVLPIAHNLPLACPGIQGFMFHGARVVLHGNTRPDEILALVEKHRVTHLKVVPALLIRLVNHPAAGNFDLSSVRLVQSGGQRMQPEVRARARRTFPQAFVQENFGMSEGLLMFVRKDDPEDVLLETCGRPVCEDDEVKLLDDEGREVSRGEVGELACRGPYTLRGYYGVPEYNAQRFTADGYYLSGDLLRLHRSGNYIVEGRKKDLINRGGEKISAEEVENLILMHPAVQNVACVPIPDEALGEKMCACVLLKPGEALTFEGLSAFLRGHEIAKFKLPERLEVFREFPLSTFGKISKKELGAMVVARMTGDSSCV